MKPRPPRRSPCSRPRPPVGPRLSPSADPPAPPRSDRGSRPDRLHADQDRAVGRRSHTRVEASEFSFTVARSDPLDDAASSSSCGLVVDFLGDEAMIGSVLPRGRSRRSSPRCRNRCGRRPGVDASPLNCWRSPARRASPRTGAFCASRSRTRAFFASCRERQPRACHEREHRAMEPDCCGSSHGDQITPPLPSPCTLPQHRGFHVRLAHGRPEDRAPAVRGPRRRPCGCRGRAAPAPRCRT